MGTLSNRPDEEQLSNDDRVSFVESLFVIFVVALICGLGALTLQ